MPMDTLNAPSLEPALSGSGRHSIESSEGKGHSISDTRVRRGSLSEKSTARNDLPRNHELLRSESSHATGLRSEIEGQLSKESTPHRLEGAKAPPNPRSVLLETPATVCGLGSNAVRFDIHRRLEFIREVVDVSGEIQRRLDFIRSPRETCSELPPRVACPGPQRGEELTRPVSDEQPFADPAGRLAAVACGAQDGSNSGEGSFWSSASDDVAESLRPASTASRTTPPTSPALSFSNRALPKSENPGSGPRLRVSSLEDDSGGAMAKWMSLPTARLTPVQTKLVSSSANVGREVRVGRHTYIAC